MKDEEFPKCVDAPQHSFETVTRCKQCGYVLTSFQPLNYTMADNLSKDAAIQRTYDLVRYARGYLLDEGLITLSEYGALVATGSKSARRLESYDELRKKLGEA